MGIWCQVILIILLVVFHSGTPSFQPPESLIKHEYEAEPTTVWGLGILMYSMLCGGESFNGPKEILDGHLNFPDHLSEGEKIEIV